VAKTRAISPLRSSRKRVERIKLKGNWPNPIELGLTILAVAIMYLLMWRANSGQ
jgi:hypothetical protein